MMVEFLGISYLKIIGYALIPCLLYFTGVFAGVHFRMVRMGLTGLPIEGIPPWRHILTLKKLAGFLVPTLGLLFMIFAGKPLINAGFYASASAIVIYFLLNCGNHSFKQLLVDLIKALSGVGSEKTDYAENRSVHLRQESRQSMVGKLNLKLFRLTLEKDPNR